MKFKNKGDIVARKFPKKKSNVEDDFVPLLEGTYLLGPEIDDRVQVLRQGKAAVFLEACKYQAHIAAGAIELAA